MTLRAAWLGGGAAVILATGSALAQGSGDPATNWASVAACAPLHQADQRLACVEAVFRATGLLDPAREIPEQRETFGEQRRRLPKPGPAKRGSAPAPNPEVGARPVQLGQIATTVSRAFDPGNRLMVIATQDGQIWQQLESKDIGLPPPAGTAFTIERGALGSFVCRIAGGRSFRCRRHD